MKVSENFVLQEFMPKHVFEKYGEASLWFIDPRIIDFVQKLRVHIGKPITINDWHVGGKYNESGFRDAKCKEYRPFSQHSFGRGIDLKVDGMTPKELSGIVITNRNLWMQIGAIEDVLDTPTWLHCDTRYTGLEQILIVKP